LTLIYDEPLSKFAFKFNLRRYDMEAQLLDSMDIERERGITIKLNSARMNYTALVGWCNLLTEGSGAHYRAVRRPL